MNELDSWGQPVAASNEDSITAWNQAWIDLLHFDGDPFGRLDHSNRRDDGFAMGSVFCATYRILGGLRLDDRVLLEDLARARLRSASRRERAHVAAVSQLAAGNFTLAGELWDAIASGNGNDLAAIRFAHDVYLHVGDEGRRLRSSTQAYDGWPRGHTGWGFVASQYAFALEEAAHYAEAEDIGRMALEDDPRDLWAMHALAHVYESVDDQEAAMSLFETTAATWQAQDGLAVHIWWHLALRLFSEDRFDEVLAIHDSLVPVASTPFRLCDLTSLLWRLELRGVDVGDRWDHLADAFAIRPEKHTSGFLDLHMAAVYARRPDHPAAERFFEGVATAHGGESENDETFRSVVGPLVEAVRCGDRQPDHAVQLLDSVSSQSHRIGGSVAQRNILNLARTAWEAP